MKINKVISTEINISVAELAELFCSMDGAGQAEFFNTIGQLVKSWDNPFVFQLQSIVETKSLTIDGSQIMFEIGQYANGLTWKEEKQLEQFMSDMPDKEGL